MNSRAVGTRPEVLDGLPACGSAQAARLVPSDNRLCRLRVSTKAVVFDMDGVLLLSSRIHEDAYREILSPFGIVIQYEEYAGMRTRDCLGDVLRKNGVTVSSAVLEELSRRKTALALQRLEDENPIAPCAVSVLKHLSARYPLALATSASDLTSSRFLRRNGLESLFGSVINGQQVRNGKPAPDIFIEACKQLSVQPASSLVIEDSVRGVTAGVSAGAIVAGVPGTTEAASLLAAGAELVLGGLEDLLNL